MVKKRVKGVPKIRNLRRISVRTESFIVQQLKKTEKPQTEIAKEARVSLRFVKKLNLVHNIRSIEDSIRIGSLARGRMALAKREKVCHFTRVKKMQLLEEHKKGITLMVKRYWGHKVIRDEHRTFQSFADATKMHVFKMLDYYNPEARGPSGNPASVGSWIINSANFFGMTDKKVLYRRHLEKNLSPAERKTKEVAAQKMLRRREIKRKLFQIPAPTKSFLKNLGLDVEVVADLGFRDIASRILKISRSKEANLKRIEKRVVSLRLDGRTFQQTGEIIGKSTELARTIQLKAISKIKARLKVQVIDGIKR